MAAAPQFDPWLLTLAFVFLLIGYGTKIGLVPLHAWLPDAHAEGPTPVSAVLSGLLLNVALYALLRFKMILAANPAAIAPGPLMMGLGLLSVVFAAFMLYRRRDIKRMFAYSSIEHMGIMVLAFGLAGPLANFAGLLQMVFHSLTKSAIFFTVGHISQVKGSQRLADIGGLTVTHPVLGWGLGAGVAARRRLGRSLAIREVDAGSCNGCELELHALNNPYYDLERFGLHFVASPRHADVLMVTGPVTKNMREALERTYQATPDPKWVVAVGDCAVSGGLFGASYACVGAVDNVVPVALCIQGCPPTPVALLKGLLALLNG